MAINKATTNLQSETALLLGLMMDNSNAVQSKKLREQFRRYPVKLMKRAVAEMSTLKMLIRLFDVRQDPLGLLNEFRKGKEQRILGGYPFFLLQHEGGLQILNQLERLNDAFRDLHQYKPEDYFTEGAYRHANGKSAALKAKNNRELEDEIRSRYLTASHGEKGDIKKDIADRYGVSKTTLDTIIRDLKRRLRGKFPTPDLGN
jgi:hypothetical protein